MYRFTLLLAVIMLCSSCAGGRHAALVGGALQKDAPVVFIHPLSPTPVRGTVGILPFQVPAGVEHGVGAGIADLFKDVLLGKQAFPRVVFIDQQYGTVGEAAALGKQTGVDLVLVGRVNRMLSGSALGGAQLDLWVRLVNVQSGDTVWYIRQTVAQPYNYPAYDLASRLRHGLFMPGAPQQGQPPSMPTMLLRIAEDITRVMGGASAVPLGSS